MTRVLVVTPEVLSERMAGPAIRAWNMAEVLSATHDVRLRSTASSSLSSAGAFEIGAVDDVTIEDERRWAEVVVAHPSLLRTHPTVSSWPAPIVVDVYDPFHLENLEPNGASLDARTANVAHLVSVINEALALGDHFLCASERQRDFWVGSLAALGRVNPTNYDGDPTLRSLIDVAPFGVPDRPPRHGRPVLRGVVPGIGTDDRILLWAGGVYDWFDPVTLIEAVDRVRRRLANVRLVFLGMSHPNPDLPPMRAAGAARARAAELGITGLHVFFNEGWVPYEDREHYLLEADVGVSTHGLHVETAYAFRTRMLDYLWAGLPIVTSEGDVFAELTAAEDLGETVSPGDVGALADALERLLGDDARRAACGSRARLVGTRYTWRRTLEPLVRFCDDPARAADRDHPGAGPEARQMADSQATDAPPAAPPGFRWRARRRPRPD